jgi:hypothetical protein
MIEKKIIGAAAAPRAKESSDLRKMKQDSTANAMHL